jgi:formylglycine-generating enzyme required for sulfatase activity
MIHIPAGDFLMGSDPTKDKDALDEEQPQHTLHLPDYYIARTPITNAQYAPFVQATAHVTTAEREGWAVDWRHPKGSASTIEDRMDHPVVYVTWRDAVAYCKWLAQLTGRPYRLPSEAEWEKAARGTDGRIYPWGNKFDPARCNSGEDDIDDTTPVGRYPAGASPYGLLDMAGNVWEWTRSLWGTNSEKPDFGYPYDPSDGREDLDTGHGVRRVVRGSSWYDDRRYARCASRYRSGPFLIILGLRVVVVSLALPPPDS